jgi:hypothetical protein
MARPSSGRRNNHVENLERREQTKSTMANVSKPLERNALRLMRKRTSSGDSHGLQKGEVGTDARVFNGLQLSERL